MQRLLWLISLFIFMVTVSQGLDSDMEILELEISDGQVAKIVPLYQDFDLFYELATGALTLTDFPREERFIIACSHMWLSTIPDLGVDALDVISETRLNQYREIANDIDDNIIEVITQSLMDSATLLPSDDLVVCIVPSPDDSSLLGIARERGMLLFMNDGINEADLLRTVSHEYHHHARDTNPFTRTSGGILVERLITEGMAEMFQQMVYPNAFAWLGYSHHEQEIWEIFEPNLRADDEATINELMFGTRDDLPSAAGYYLGFRILEAYIENNPDVDIEEWTLLSGDQILNASGYEPDS